MKIVRILEKTVKIHKLKKRIFFFYLCTYKIVEISKETWKQYGVEVIASGGKK